MIKFLREKAVITVTLDTTIGWNFNATINCQTEPYALLLKTEFEKTLGERIETIRRLAYNQGWKDKQKHTLKKTWFSKTISNNQF